MVSDNTQPDGSDEVDITDRTRRIARAALVVRGDRSVAGAPPSRDEIDAYVTGALDAADRRRVERHAAASRSVTHELLEARRRLAPRRTSSTAASAALGLGVAAVLAIVGSTFVLRPSDTTAVSETVGALRAAIRTAWQASLEPVASVRAPAAARPDTPSSDVTALGVETLNTHVLCLADAPRDGALHRTLGRLASETRKEILGSLDVATVGRSADGDCELARLLLRATDALH